MKIEQKFSIGKKGFNFNDVRQVIDLLRDKVNNDIIVVVKKSCGYFTLDECGYGWIWVDMDGLKITLLYIANKLIHLKKLLHVFQTF